MSKDGGRRRGEGNRVGRGAGTPSQGPSGGVGLRNVGSSPAIAGHRHGARAWCSGQVDVVGAHGGSLPMVSVFTVK